MTESEPTTDQRTAIPAWKDTSQASADIDMDNVLERAGYYLDHGVEEFLDHRLAWLSESDAVRVQEVRPGAFDIVLCLDGRWSSRESAEGVRAFLAEEVMAVCAVLRKHAEIRRKSAAQIIDTEEVRA